MKGSAGHGEVAVWCVPGSASMAAAGCMMDIPGSTRGSSQAWGRRSAADSDAWPGHTSVRMVVGHIIR
jgi:hypothetical protein